MKKIYGFYAFLALVGFVSFVFAMEVTKQDSKFMMQAASSDMMEIATSSMALQKSQNADVRRFAQMMVDDHTKTSDQLKSIAASKNVTLPAQMDSKHRAMVERLSALSGDRFDMEYMRGQVKAHEAAVKLFQTESNKGSDPDVKGFASTNLPALQTHLTMARTISGNMRNGGGNSNRNTNSGGGNTNGNMNMNGNMNGNMNMNMNSNGNSNRGGNTNSNNRNTNNNRNRNNNTNGNTNGNMNTNSNR